MADRYQQLHAYIMDALDDIRRAFDELHIAEFRLDIECRGRVADWHPKVSYVLSCGSYGTQDSSTSARLGPAIEETQRRYSWNKRNDPLAITDNSKNGDDISF